MIVEVITKRDALSELSEICWLLKEAKETTSDSSRRWRLAKIIVEAEETYDTFVRYFEITKFSPREKKFQTFVNQLKKSDADPCQMLVSLAFSRAGGLADAQTEGFTMTEEIHHKIRELSRQILDFLHQMRQMK